MALNTLQKANFRKHTHYSDQVIDPDTQAPIEPGGGGAPTDATYLVTTANGSLSAEVVVGATPGGELGGTWASPTVDSTHAGSAHVALTSSAPQSVGTANAAGSGTASAKDDHVHAHETAHINHDTTWAAKGDLIAGTANDTAAVLTVGADDTILMADSGQSAGLKWVASASPSTQAFGDSAVTGTGDTFTRGDHKHAMPTLGYGLSGNSAPAVGLTTASAFTTATTSISAATYADITGASISLAAGTWIIGCVVNGSSVNAAAIMSVAITDNSNTVIVEGTASMAASGSASVATTGCVSLGWFVTPGGTTTYKLRAARGTTTITGTWVAMDGGNVNTTNNLTDNSDKGTGIWAIRIA